MQQSVVSGEVSRALYGRVDLAKYHSAMALARNVFVDYRGGASNRAGTRFIARAFDSSYPVRLIPFSFNTLQTYQLEFGNQYMRVIKDGGLVLETAKNILSLTNAAPPVVELTAHGYINGDWVWVQSVGGTVELNQKYFTVVIVDADHISLYDLDGNAVDATAYGLWTGGGTVSKVFILGTPYDGNDLALLKYVQSADVMTLTHPSYQAHNLTRTGHAAWTLTAITFSPSIAAPTVPAAVPSAAGATTYRYVVTTRARNGVQQSLPSVVATAVSAPMSTTVGSYITLSWVVDPDGQSYDVYRQAEVIGAAPDPDALYGYVGTSIGDGFVDQNISPDFSNTPPQEVFPFVGNNPGCSTYFQQRQLFAASAAKPQTIWGSKSADFPNFTYSIPTQDDDSITNTLVAREVNAIKHMIPMTSLIALTANGAWRIDGGQQSDVITPSKFVALPQAYNGCSDVPPLVINYDILYIQAKGSTVRDLSYNFYANIYTGSDVSILAKHLFTGHTISEWAWAEEPFKLIWAIRDDGVLLTMTYIKDQDIYAWAHSDTNGRFRSVSTITEGNEDSVYVVVERLIGGQYLKYIEQMVSRDFGDDVTEAWFVDCGLRYPLTYLAAQATPSGLVANVPDDGGQPTYGETNGIGVLTADAAVFTPAMIGNTVRINGGYGDITACPTAYTVNFKVLRPIKSLWPADSGDWSCTAKVMSVSGLDHLEGQTVAAIADGSVTPQQVVVGGQVTLQAEASSIFVGLPYKSQVQTLPLDISGVEPTIQGKRKTIPAVTLRVANSRGLKVGPNFNSLRPIKERRRQPYGLPIELINGDERISIQSTWTVPGQVCAQQDDPLPFTILAFIPEVVVGDSA